MGSGLIEAVAVTPANVPDQEAFEHIFKHICPENRIVFGDKAYCLGSAQLVMKIKGCASAAILKNNMTAKNRDRDRWLSSIRMPFKNIFSKQNFKALYLFRREKML